MLKFDSDYMEGCHPNILGRLLSINLEKNTGYGKDEICESAKDRIRKACGAPKADVYFLVGGTQTNSTVLAGLLEKYQGVISAKTGHIACHEAGAVEYTGHKVIELPCENGKIAASTIDNYCTTFFADESNDHMVEPGVVYISQPTEYGTVYSLNELKEISAVCKKHNQKLYVDGARLGYALTCKGNDVTLKELAKYADAFYIGGTKVGAMMGEAVVLPKPNTIPHFFTIIKQHGALLAKGWLLGVQFDELFKDDLYLTIAKNAIDMAVLLEEECKKLGYKIYMENPTNQKFVIIENKQLGKLRKNVSCTVWEKYDDEHTVVRFATSWATTKEQIESLINLLK